MELLSELKRRKMMTPDLVDLDNGGLHLLFVYDNLKFGFTHHNLVSASQYLGRARTMKFNFQLKQTHSMPILIEGPSTVSPESPYHAKVFGEVYAVDLYTLIEIDRHMNHTQLFNRQLEYCVMEDQHSPFKTDLEGKKTPLCRQCHVYVGNMEVWEHAQLVFCSRTYRDRIPLWEWKKSDVGKALMVN